VWVREHQCCNNQALALAGTAQQLLILPHGILQFLRSPTIKLHTEGSSFEALWYIMYQMMVRVF